MIATFLKHQKCRLFAILCIIGMVLLLNLQLVMHLTSHFIGRPFEDAISVMWQFWWASKAAGENEIVLYTPNVYYPNGYYLGSDAQPIWWMVVYVPLTRVLGPLATYNIVTLTTLIVAGVGVYLLVESLTGKCLAGIVASPVYIFAPVITLRLGGHLNVLLAAQWLPYLALFSYRSLANAGRRGWIFSVLVGLMYFLASISSLYFVFIGFIPVISVFLFSSLECSKTRRFQKLGVALVTWCLLTMPFLMLTLQANRAMFGKTVVEFDLASSDGWSINVDRLFTPNPANAVWRKWLSRRLDIGGESDYISLGYTAMLLALLGIWKSDAARESTRSAIVLVSLSIILAMGTTLHWNHQRILVELPPSLAKLYGSLTKWLTIVVTDEPAIPLPGLLLARLVPFYAAMRVWARFMIAGMLGLAVLAGHGASFVLSEKRYARYWMTIAAALILVEGVMIPYSEFTPIRMIQRPVDFWLAEQPEGTALIEYPWPYMNKNALYSQTIHEQPIVNGYAPHIPRHLQQSPEVMSTWPDQAAVATLREWGVHYILVTEFGTRESGEIWASLQALSDLRWVRSYPSAVGKEGVQVHVFEIVDD